MENKQEKPASLQYLLPKELESELRKACEEMTAEHQRPITFEVLGDEGDECCYYEYRIRIGEAGDGEPQGPVPTITYDLRSSRNIGSFRYQIDDIRMMVRFYMTGTEFANKYNTCAYDAANRYFRLQTCNYASPDSLFIYVNMGFGDRLSVSCTISPYDRAILTNMQAFAKSGLVTAEIPLIKDSYMKDLSCLASMYDNGEKPPYFDHTEQISETEKRISKRDIWVKLFRSRKNLGESSVPNNIYGAFTIARAIGNHDIYGLNGPDRMHLLDSALTSILNDPRVTITKNVVIPNDTFYQIPPSIGYIEFEVGENKFFLYCNFAGGGDVHVVETSTNSAFVIRPNNWVVNGKYPDVGVPLRRFLGL